MNADDRGLTRMSIEDAEFYRWLVDVERRAILPLKWILLLGTVFLWQYTRAGLIWPEADVFTVFFIYWLSILANHYFFAFSKVPLHQVRAFCYVSYGVDLAYVTGLIYLDSLHRNISGLESPDFYILYFLLLIRGFVLYRGTIEKITVNLGISLLFIFSFWVNEHTLAFLFKRPFLVKMSLVWMVILLAWFIFEIINRQKFELLRARERLYQSERLTALGELAAGIAHEINNPIGIISAYADYLIRQVEVGDARREDYEVIHSEAQRCKRTVGELLRFARPSETQREPTDLCALNDEVLRFIFHDRTNETIRLQKSYELNLPWVLVDPTQIKQALLNVYVNAQQALGVEGGEIRVLVASATSGARLAQSSASSDFGELSRAAEPPSRELRRWSSRYPGRAVQVTIADTGPGIAAQDLPRVFDPFFTRKPAGSGLGLSITRRLLEANDGEIELRSNQPHGVVVTIAFHALVASGTASGKML